MQNNKEYLFVELKSTFEDAKIYKFLWIPFFNFCLICLGMILLSSEWLSPPSLSISVPISSISALTNKPVDCVVSIDADKRIFFNKKFYTIDTLAEALSTNALKGKKLLVKADASLPIETTTQIINIAHKNACKEVQLAVAEK